MHVYEIVHRGEFNKNGNLNFTQLFYAWLQIRKRDLHGNENLRRRKKKKKKKKKKAKIGAMSFGEDDE